MTCCPYLHPFINDTLDYVQDIGLHIEPDLTTSKVRGGVKVFLVPRVVECTVHCSEVLEELV